MVCGFKSHLPHQIKKTPCGVFFIWCQGERKPVLKASLCPDETRKTTLTVFFHTFFPSVGDKPAQKSLGVFFIWCQGEQKACAKGWSVP